jgi:hypothetical protein
MVGALLGDREYGILDDSRRGGLERAMHRYDTAYEKGDSKGIGFGVLWGRWGKITDSSPFVGTRLV